LNFQDHEALGAKKLLQRARIVRQPRDGECEAVHVSDENFAVEMNRRASAEEIRTILT
jgi:hypothetical protein